MEVSDSRDTQLTSQSKHHSKERLEPLASHSRNMTQFSNMQNYQTQKIPLKIGKTKKEIKEKIETDKECVTDI